MTNGNIYFELFEKREKIGEMGKNAENAWKMGNEGGKIFEWYWGGLELKKDGTIKYLFFKKWCVKKCGDGWGKWGNDRILLFQMIWMGIRGSKFL